MRDRRGSYIGFTGAQGTTVYDDSTYPNVILLMHFDGAEGGVSFVDSSQNSFNITYTGTVTTSTAAKKFGSGSLLFKNVNASYLVLNNSTTGTQWPPKFNFTTGDYTVEAWVLLQDYNTNGACILDIGANVSGAGAGFNFYIDSSGRLETNQQNIPALLNPPAKTAQAYSVVNVTSIAAGVTVPTAAFPTASPADPYFSSVQLLLQMDGTDSVFTDSSTTPKSIVATGNVTQTTAQSVWGGKSAYFDGVSSSYLSIADNAALEFGSNPVVIEFWLRTTQTLQYATLLNRQLSGFPAGSWTFMLNSSTGAGDLSMYMADYSTGIPVAQTTGVNLIDGAWHYITYIKNDNAHYIFVDGVVRATGTGNTTVTDITAPLLIGTDAIYTPRTYAGYIDDLRITVGTARGIVQTTTNTLIATTNHNLSVGDQVYLTFPSFAAATGTYTVATTPTTNQFSVLTTISVGTSGTVDVTPLPPLVGTYAQSSTTITVTCVNHGLAINDSVVLTFITGSGRTGTYIVTSVPNANTFSVTAFIVLTASGAVTVVPAAPIGTWTHVALVRRSGITTAYLNGVKVKQTAIAANYNLSAYYQPVIGVMHGTSNPFSGSIDELTVSNIARYSSNFTPPTAPYSEATARVSGFWTQREAEQYQRLTSWVGDSDPRASETLSLWLDAADATALWDSTAATTSSGNLITDDTTSVGRWQDKSNYARHFTRPGTTSGLKRVANGKNGLPIVRFGATSNEYFNGPTWNTLASANGFTVLIAAKVNNVNLTTGAEYYANTATLLSASYQNQLGFSTTQAVHYMYSLGIGTNYTPGTWAIFTMTYNATGAVQRILVNNAGVSTVTGANQNSGAAVSLGYNNYGGQYASTDIAELLFFNSELSTEMQTVLYNYLQSKWAIT